MWISQHLNKTRNVYVGGAVGKPGKAIFGPSGHPNVLGTPVIKCGFNEKKHLKKQFSGKNPQFF